MTLVDNMQIEFLIRLIAAGLCGVAIGMERQIRMKNAGLRTHFLVALASCLMMIISKYGFYDVLAQNVGISVDASRIAAGIITGIGILGSGIVFISKQGLVSGMTTAAGIWVTLGIGMAIGAGMYPLGIECTVITIMMQCVFHMNVSMFKETIHGKVIFLADNDPAAIHRTIDKLKASKVDIVRIKVDIIDKEKCRVTCVISIPPKYATDDIVGILMGIDEHIESIAF